VAAASGFVAVLVAAAGEQGAVESAAKLIAAGALGYVVGQAVGARVELLVIAGVIAVSDIVSVLRGPTKLLAAHHPATFAALTVHFHPVGTNRTAELGTTDILFLAAFLAAADRLGLRVVATWIAMVLSFAVTVVISAATDHIVPALPLLAAGAVIANADLLVSRRALDRI
jgi:hypothetical protein